MNAETFLVVDCYEDNRWLVVLSLRRKFPDALVLECGYDDEVVKIASTHQLTAVISHRAGGMDADKTVTTLRGLLPNVPIIMMSGFDLAAEAKMAGAARFHAYDRWQEIGTVVAGVLT
jgi:hypothetical protein